MRGLLDDGVDAIARAAVRAAVRRGDALVNAWSTAGAAGCEGNSARGRVSPVGAGNHPLGRPRGP